MATIKNILLALSMTLAAFVMYSQKPLTINLSGSDEIIGIIEDMGNEIFVMVENSSGIDYEAYLVVELTGTTASGSQVYASNATSAPSYPITIGPEGLNIFLGLLIEEYQQTSFDEFNFGSTPQALIQQIIRTRSFPAGNYNICLVAYDVVSHLQLSEAGINNCHSFQVVFRNAPEINSPEDEAMLEYDLFDVITFHWLMDDFNDDDRFKIELIKFPTEEAFQEFKAQGNPHLAFETYLPILVAEDIPDRMYSTDQADIPPELEPGDNMAVRVTVVNPRTEFRNQGMSQIHTFNYGVDHATGCGNPDFTAEMIYPVAHDTLPFTDIYFVAKFNPSCDNLQGVKTEITYYRSGGGSVGSIEYSNRWVVTGDGRNDGPRNFLERYFERYSRGNLHFYLPEHSDYEKYIPFLHDHNTFSANRGESIYAGISMEFEYKKLPSGGTEWQSFPIPENSNEKVTIGMPKPILISPENNAVVSPGSIEFRFETGNVPTNPLPPFKVFRIEGSNPPIKPGFDVKEKCVLQVASEKTFQPENILHCRMKKVQNEPYDNRTTYREDDPVFETMGSLYDNTPERLFDESHFLTNVYKEMDVSFNINREDTLYWRVVWLKEPDRYETLTPCGTDGTIRDADIYHQSSARKLIIKEGGSFAGGGTGTEEEEEDSGDCGSPCTFPRITDRENFPHLAVDDIVKIAGFNMKIKELRMEDGAGSGVGHIKLPFLGGLEIVVSFNGLKININKQVFAGLIMPVKEQEFEIKEKSPGDFGKLFDMDKEVSDALLIHLNHEKKMLSDLINHEGAVTLPIGIDKELEGGNKIVIGVMSMTFETDTAYVDLVLNIDVPDLSGFKFISLGASVCMTKDGFANDVKLYLPANHEFPLEEGSDDPTTFIIKGAQGRSKRDVDDVTFVKFDCDGFKELSLAGAVKFSRSVIVPDSSKSGTPAKEGNAEFGFLAKIKKNDDYLFKLNATKFHVPDLDGWVFNPATQIWIDLSDTENPTGLSFPGDYEHPTGRTPEMINTWKGFYMESVGVGIPDYFNIKEGRTTSLSVQKLIIDNTGISFKLAAENLIEWDGAGEGNADLIGWKASLDKVYFEVLQNRPLGIGFEGKLGLPITEKTQYLKYEAQLGQENGQAKFIFSVKPKDDLKIPISMAMAKVKKTSYVKIVVGRESFIEARLDATLTLGNSNLNEESQDDMASTLSLPGLAVEKFVVNSKTGLVTDDFRYCISSDCDTNPRSWHSGARGSSGSGGSEGGGSSMPDEGLLESFALLESSGPGQGDMSGFPISLKKFEISNSGVTIEPALTISSGTNGISGSAEIELHISTGDNFDRFEVRGVTLHAIHIKLETSDLELEGRLKFYNEPFGDGKKEGVKGGITLSINMGQKIGMDINAEFGVVKTPGATSFGGSDYFSYFNVDGLVVFPGMPIFSGISLYGLGGGFYYNMEMVGLPSGEAVAAGEGEDGEVDDDGNARKKSGVNYSPKHGRFGLMFTAILGSNDQGKAYNFDVTLKADFSESHGLIHFGFMGSFRAATDGISPQSIRKADNSPVAGFLKIDVNLPLDAPFTVTGNLFVKIAIPNPSSPVIRGTAGSKDETKGEKPDGWDAMPEGWEFKNGMVWADFYASPDTWHFYMGTQETPGGVEAVLGDFRLEISNYLMIGHGIPGRLPTPHPEFTEIFEKASRSQIVSKYGDPNAIKDGPVDRTQMETGEGFAAGLTMVLHTGNVYILPFFFNLKMVMGADILLRHYEGGFSCPEYPEIVDPGTDNWYAQGQIYAGIEGKFGMGVNIFGIDLTVTILEACAALSLKIGLPNPEWLEGKGSFYYEVPGLISGNCNFQVQIGTRCEPSQTDILADLKMIQDISPEDGSTNVSVYSDISVAFTMAMGKTFTIPQYVDDDSEPLIRKFRPYLHKLNLYEGWNESSPEFLDFEDEKWTDNYHIYTKDPNIPLASRKRHGVRAEARVKEIIRRGGMDIEMDYQKDGSPYAEVRWSKFTTGNEPDYIAENNLYFTYPYINQQNFLKRETINGEGYIATLSDLNKCLNEQAPPSFRRTFYARYTSDDDVVTEKPIRIIGSRRYVTFPVDHLENDKIYCIQIIRKDEPLVQFKNIDLSGLPDVQDSGEPGLSYASMKNIRIKLNTSLSTIDFSEKFKQVKLPAGKKEKHETIVYEYYFKTSKYNTMKQKLTQETRGFEANKWNFLGIEGHYVRKERMDEKMEWVDHRPFQATNYEKSREFSRRVWFYVQPPLENLDGVPVGIEEIPVNPYLQKIVLQKILIEHYYASNRIYRALWDKIQEGRTNKEPFPVGNPSFQWKALSKYETYQATDIMYMNANQSVLAPLSDSELTRAFTRYASSNREHIGAVPQFYDTGLRIGGKTSYDLFLEFNLHTAGNKHYQKFYQQVVNFAAISFGIPAYSLLPYEEKMFIFRHLGNDTAAKRVDYTSFKRYGMPNYASTNKPDYSYYFSMKYVFPDYTGRDRIGTVFPINFKY